jgi:thiol-disulfide isomerase/thioredoxin
MRILAGLVLSSLSLFAAGELSNRRAPGFSLVDSNFKQYDPADYRGKILLIDVMQTTCPHCAAFSAVLEEVASKYAGRVAVLAIVNPPDNFNKVKQYLVDHKVTVPILFDCGQAAASYLRSGPQNPTFNIPHLFIVDPQGMIRNDYEYSPLTHDIFEGRALFAELDRMLAPPAKSK